MRPLRFLPEHRGAIQRAAFFLSLFLLLAFTTPINAQDFVEVIKRVAGGGSTDGQFGYSVSISGNYAVIGAPYDDNANGSNAGAAYVFMKDLGGVDNWGQVKKILAADGTASDNFGWTVSINGNYVIVGVPADNGSTGSAYIFSKDQGGANNWGQVKKLTAGDAAGGDLFGQDVDISGDYAVVGAYKDDDKGIDSGSAYIFSRNEGGADNWGQVKKLTVSDGLTQDWFGYSLAIDGNDLIVGAPNDDDKGSNSGTAFIYQKDQGGANNWGLVKKLTAIDGEVSDAFGFDVDISGDYAIVGMPNDDDKGANAGAVYILQRNQGGPANWGLVKKNTAADGTAGDGLGWSVAIGADYALAGAPFDLALEAGSAYVFQRNKAGLPPWGELQKLLPSDGSGYDNFGWSLSLSGYYALFGSPYAFFGGVSGFAYIFEDSCLDMDGDGYDDVACGGDDCDDTNPDINPGATEICNDIDDDCDGDIDTDDDNLVDNDPPTVGCQGMPISFDGEDAFDVADYVSVSAEDNCGVATTVFSPATITCEQVGTTVPVIVTVTDVNGNMSQCTTAVQVTGFPCGFSDSNGIGCNAQASYSPTTGTFTLQTNGCNSSDPHSDAQGFIGYEICGDGSISFRVAGLSSNSAFAGIALRASLAPNAVKAEVVTNRATTARGAVRETTGGAAWPQPFFLYNRHWLRLERQGNQVRIYTSTNGQSWTILMVRNLTLPNCVQLGMVAYGPGMVTATFDNVVVSGSGNGNLVVAPGQVEAPLSSPRKEETGPLQTSPEGGGFPLEETSPQPSTVLAVYPNPTAGPLTVELPADLPLEDAALEVLDSYGRSLLRETRLDYRGQLDLSRLPPGAYFLRLQLADGARMIERVVVQP